MRIFLALLFLFSVFAGFILAAHVFKLGLEVALERYGAVFTVISGFSLLPLLLCLAFLGDRARGRDRW